MPQCYRWRHGSQAGGVALSIAICYAFTYVLTRSLTRTDGPLAILLYMNLMQTPLALLASWGDWSMPSDTLYPWILMLGISGLTAHYCLARALALADTSLVIPLDFVRLPLIAVIGVLAYGEAIDPLVLVGAAIVVAGNPINVRTA